MVVACYQFENSPQGFILRVRNAGVSHIALVAAYTLTPAKVASCARSMASCKCFGETDSRRTPVGLPASKRSRRAA